MKHKTIQSKQGIIHYWVAGDSADCILFTHGATMDHGLFQPQMDYFAARYKVISWDVPLHGQSRPYQGFSLQHAANALTLLLDAEHISKAHLVGQSMGGYIIQIATLDYPDRALSLTVVDSSPIQASYYSKIDKWLLSITPPLLRLYPYKALIKAIATQVALTDSAQSYALETLQGLTKAEIATILEKVYQGVQVYNYDFQLPLPILIVYGESDNTGKVQSYCKQWAQHEQRTLKVIPHAAHNANMDNPAAFNPILDDFLQTTIGNTR